MKVEVAGSWQWPATRGLEVVLAVVLAVAVAGCGLCLCGGDQGERLHQSLAAALTLVLDVLAVRCAVDRAGRDDSRGRRAGRGDGRGAVRAAGCDADRGAGRGAGLVLAVPLPAAPAVKLAVKPTMP